MTTNTNLVLHVSMLVMMLQLSQLPPRMDRLGCWNNLWTTININKATLPHSHIFCIIMCNMYVRQNRMNIHIYYCIDTLYYLIYLNSTGLRFGNCKVDVLRNEHLGARSVSSLQQSAAVCCSDAASEKANGN